MAKKLKFEPPPVITASARELATLFSCSGRQVRALGAKNIIPRLGRGRYRRDKSITNYILHLREIAAGRAGHEKGPDLVSAAAELKIIQAAAIKQRMDVLSGKLLPAEMIAPAWDRMTRDFRGAVLAVPPRCRARLPGELSAHGQVVMEEELRDALTK
jgi:phage terminase Nu1 subunit (DNA packaging protein)